MAAACEGRGNAKVLMVLGILAAMIHSCLSAEHNIGRWVTGKQAEFKTWSQNTTFHIDDTLKFEYSANYHNVLEVNKEDYDSCVTTNAIVANRTDNAIMTLASPGPHYFICGVAGHCMGGQKVTVNVADRSTAAPPSPVLPSAPAPGSFNPADPAPKSAAGPLQLSISSVAMAISTLTIGYMLC